MCLIHKWIRYADSEDSWYWCPRCDTKIDFDPKPWELLVKDLWGAIKALARRIAHFKGRD